MKYFPEYTHNLVQKKRNYKGWPELQKNKEETQHGSI